MPISDVEIVVLTGGSWAYQFATDDGRRWWLNVSEELPFNDYSFSDDADLPMEIGEVFWDDGDGRWCPDDLQQVSGVRVLAPYFCLRYLAAYDPAPILRSYFEEVDAV